MKRLVFDIETDGLLPELTKIHCIATIDPDTGEESTFVNKAYKSEADGTIEDALVHLAGADLLIGHNIAGFDIPAIQKLTNDKVLSGSNLFDTMLMAGLAFPAIKKDDFKRIQLDRIKRVPDDRRFPPKLAGRHSLEAWGYRLGIHKGTFGIERSDWSVYDEDMLRYCVQDVRVNVALYLHLANQNLDERAVDLEHRFAKIMNQQERDGVEFDEAAGRSLAAEMQKERYRLTEELKETFPPETVTTYTPKKKLRRDKVVEFNPGSRIQVAKRLMELGWRPTEYTPSGQAEVSHKTLEALPYPEAKPLARYFVLQKLLGYLTDGKNAWLKLVKDGRLHGRTLTVGGTPHGRVVHFSPNLAQVPSIRKAFGAAIRALFTSRVGWKMVGCDAAGIQLCALAHYMARYDDGAYIDVVVNQDPHAVNQKAMGLGTRDEAKTKIYAFLFGAGEENLGDGDRKAGAALMRRLYKNLPALKALVGAAKSTAKSRGHLVGLVGQPIPISSDHVALNYLLAAFEAVVMKTATVILHSNLKSSDIPNDAYVQVLHVHDEFQFEVKEEYATDVGKLAARSIQQAGEALGVRCPLAGEFKVGDNWADTH